MWRARRTSARSHDAELASSLTIRAVLVSRAVVWASALATIAIFGRNVQAIAATDPGRVTEPFRAAWVNFLFAPALRWDSAWYLQIAHAGYYSRLSSAFFPLYPLLIHLGAAVFGSAAVVGLLISLGSLVVGLYVTYLLARLDLSEPAARTTVLLVAFFPTAFFLSAVYTEAVFLALSVGAIYAARQERWWLGSALGCLAAASRSNGVLILVPLVVIYLYGPRALPAVSGARRWWQPRYRLSRSCLWLTLVPAGVLAYLVYLWITHDAPLAPYQVQSMWSREFAGPFAAVVQSIGALPGDVHRMLSGTTLPVGPGDPISWTAHNLIDVGFLAFALAGLAFAWRRVPFAYFAYAVVMLAQNLAYPSASEPLLSFSRFVLVIFPLFMGWGGKLADKPVARRTTLALSALLLVGFSGLWGYWAWVA